KETIPISCLARQSCFLVNPCAAPRFCMVVAGTGPFARISIRNDFILASFSPCATKPAFFGCRSVVFLTCCGCPGANRLNMSFATAVIPWLVHRDCRDHRRVVDLVGVGVVGVDFDRLAVPLDMIGPPD